MHGPRRIDTAIVDKQPDAEVESADRILIIDGVVGDRFADDNRHLDVDSSAHDAILRLLPDSDLREGFGNVFGLADFVAADARKHVAGAYAGIASHAAGKHVQGNDFVLFGVAGGGSAIDPG